MMSIDNITNNLYYDDSGDDCEIYLGYDIGMIYIPILT